MREWDEGKCLLIYPFTGVYLEASIGYGQGRACSFLSEIGFLLLIPVSIYRRGNFFNDQFRTETN